ncbi:MAG: CopG family transcriptional regulator [Clostridia bacterium]|nr:CopG family transcriptional regulator [Clostridia bacterium]
MKKSKYELLLSDELIERIDHIAKRRATSRSATVNRLLLEYLEIDDQERQIDSLFSEIESYFDGEDQPMPFHIPGYDSIYLKSRNVVGIHYEILLREGNSGIEGDIRAYFRTNSEMMNERFASFFSFIKLIESRYLPLKMRYGMSDGAFTRSFRLLPDQNSKHICAYIGMIDRLLKGYLTDVFSDRELEIEFMQYLQEGYAGI